MSDRQIMMDIIEKVFIKFKSNLEKGDDGFNEYDAHMVLSGLEKVVKPILSKDEFTIQDVQYELDKQYDQAMVSAFTIILCRMMDQPLTAMGGKVL